MDTHAIKQNISGTSADDNPVIDQTALSITLNPQETSNKSVSTSDSPLLGTFYEVLTPYQDDVIFISHTDIIRTLEQNAWSAGTELLMKK